MPNHRRLLLFATAAALAGCDCGGTPNNPVCEGRQPGDLVITEFLADPDGTDTGQEWFEVFDTLGTDLDLGGMTLYVKKTDGTGLKSHLVRAGKVSSRGYFTFGDVRTGALPSWIGYSYGTDLGALGQSSGVIGIRCKDTVLDEVTYTVAAKAGHARQLNGKITPDATVNDDETNWCDAPNAYSGNNYGSPAMANPECIPVAGPGDCIEGGIPRPIESPLAGELVITEVMANPKAVSDTDGEWVELHANKACDLNGLALETASASYTFKGTNCIRLQQGEWAVLAKDFDGGVNGGLSNVRATFTSSLLNSAGVLTLALGDAGLDSATLPAALDGVAWQLGLSTLDSVSNDDAGSWCPAPVRYGDPDAGDLGTPGAANLDCPPPVNPDDCLDPGTMTMRPIRRPVVGDLALCEWMADPKAVADTAGEWFEVRVLNDVDLNGVVLRSGTSSSTLSSANCLPADAGSLLVFARNADPGANGGLPAVAGTFGFDLTNGGATIELTLADGGVLDQVTYASATAGASFYVDGSKCDPVQNDMPANICVTPAGTTYGTLPDGGPGDRGTPGVTNGTCP